MLVLLSILSQPSSTRPCKKAQGLADGFARAIGVSPMRVSRGLNGEQPVDRSVSASCSARRLGGPPELWLDFQAASDLARVHPSARRELTRIPPMIVGVGR